MTKRQPSLPMPVAVLLSGTGRTLDNLLARIESDRLPIRIARVISSHAGVRGLQIAADAGIDHRVVAPGDYRSVEEYSHAIFESCREVAARLVVMAGFIRFVRIPSDFDCRVVNIHPSLIPAFCGKGFYGSRVHQAVLEYGVKLTGCTVHFVDNQYDHGPIIMQQAVPVLDGDTADRLAARVFEAECQLYPAAIAAIATNRVHVEDRWVRIDPVPNAAPEETS